MREEPKIENRYTELESANKGGNVYKKLALCLLLSFYHHVQDYLNNIKHQPKV